MFTLLLHHNESQNASCLEGLVEYAKEVSQTAFAKSFETVAAFVSWCRLQPVKYDCGEGSQRGGCDPAQRGRVWPLDGMNCWEATAHFVGVALALRPEVALHIFDVNTPEGGRHVFPALQNVLRSGPILEVVLQPENAVRAQAWYNKIADVAHGIGSLVLGIFGAGALVPLVEQAWAAAPEEYGLSKNKPIPQAEPPQTNTGSADAKSLEREIAVLQKKLAELTKGGTTTPISKGSGAGRGSTPASTETGEKRTDTDAGVVEYRDPSGGVVTEEADRDSEILTFEDPGTEVFSDGAVDTDAGSLTFEDPGTEVFSEAVDTDAGSLDFDDGGGDLGGSE